MGVHRIGLRRLDYRIFEADDFDRALARTERELAPDERGEQSAIGRRSSAP